MHANIQASPKPVEEVISLLANLLEAWEQVVVTEGDTSRPGAPQSAGVLLTG